MAPKGKGKGKQKESGGSSSSQEEGVRATNIFDIILDDLKNSNKRTMKAIPIALKELLLCLAKRKGNRKTRLKKVHRKLYTFDGGTFIIRIMKTTDSPPEEHLLLLFRWSDLYYVGYHCKGVWYRLNDDLKDELPLPPWSQVPYKNQKNGGVVDLPCQTTYPALGGYEIFVGQKSFVDLYEALLQTAELRDQSRLHELFELCQMSLPAVAFSEALRSRELPNWVSSQIALGPNNRGEEKTPEKHNVHFNSWGDDSVTMFESRDRAPPEEIASRLSILKTPSRFVQIPLTKNPHYKGDSSQEEDVLLSEEDVLLSEDV